MRIEVVKHLKAGHDYWEKGTILDDKESPIPKVILNSLSEGHDALKVLDDLKEAPAPSTSALTDKVELSTSALTDHESGSADNESSDFVVEVDEPEQELTSAQIALDNVPDDRRQELDEKSDWKISDVNMLRKDEIYYLLTTKFDRHPDFDTVNKAKMVSALLKHLELA